MEIRGRGSMQFDRKRRTARVRWSYAKGDGTYGTVQKVFHDVGTKAEAWEKADAYRATLGTSAIDADVKLSAYIATWFDDAEHREPPYAPSTLRAYHVAARNALAHIEDVPLREIGPKHLRAMERSLRKAGKGQHAIVEAHRFVTAVVRDAVREGILTVYPLALMKSPKRPAPQRKALPLEEAARMRRLLLDGPKEGITAGILLGLTTGCRLGEVAGLTWDRVDLNCPVGDVVLGKVRIDRQRSETGTGFARTKSRSSVRVVYIDPEVRDWLELWKVEQAAMLLVNGAEQGPGTAVCTSRFMEGFTKAGFSRAFQTWREENGFDGLRFHELRHTMATLQVAGGIDVTTLQAIGGWSNVRTPLSFYTHVVESNLAKGALAYGEILSKSCQNLLQPVQ